MSSLNIWNIGGVVSKLCLIKAADNAFTDVFVEIKILF